MSDDSTGTSGAVFFFFFVVRDNVELDVSATWSWNTRTKDDDGDGDDEGRGRGQDGDRASPGESGRVRASWGRVCVVAASRRPNSAADGRVALRSLFLLRRRRQRRRLLVRGADETPRSNATTTAERERTARKQRADRERERLATIFGRRWCWFLLFGFGFFVAFRRRTLGLLWRRSARVGSVL